MNNGEYLELKNLLLDQRAMIEILIPIKSTISHISSITGRSRQTITSFVKNNFEPDVDYWIENGKICVSKTATIELLRKYNHER